MPLLALNQFGELYEENAIRDDGKGIGRIPTFADEGSTVFGALDKQQIKNRKIHQKRMAKLSSIKKAALAKKKKVQQMKNAQAEKIRAKREALEKREQALRHKKMALLVNEGKKQRQFGYEFNSLYGDIDERFDEGVVVGSDFRFHGDEFESVENFGASTLLSTGFADYDEGMGKFKLKKIVKAVAKPVAKAVTVAAKPVAKVATVAAKTTGKTMTVVNPVTAAAKIAKAVPIVKNVYKEADKFTGGVLTKAEKASTLSERALKGEKISKAELMDTALSVAKVASIAATGGSSAALISAGAGQLKQGTLGKTALGKKLLTVGEVAGIATVAASAASSQAAVAAGKAASKKIAEDVASEAAKKAFTSSIQSQAESKIKEKVQSIAEAKFQKATGIPLSTASKIYDVTSGNVSIATLPKDIASKVTEEALKKAGLSDIATQALLSNNAKALGVQIAELPNLALSQLDRKNLAATLQKQLSTEIDKLKKSAKDAADSASKKVDELKSLQLSFDKASTIAEKNRLSALMSKLNSEIKSLNDTAAKNSVEAEKQTAQASIKVAAAQEGRYIASQYVHPMIALDKRIRGVA